MNARHPSGLRALMPREHGLWSWICVPLGVALWLAPSLSGALAAGAILVGAGAANAFRRGAREPMGLAGALSAVLAVAAVAVTAQPEILAAILGISAVGAAVLTWWFRKPLPGSGLRTALEAGVIVGFGLVASGLSLFGGLSVEAAVAVQLPIAAWQVTGVWWINRSFRTFRRVQPGAYVGPLAAALAWLSAIAVALWSGLVVVLALPVLYLARTRVHPPMQSPKDAKRIGLTELAWTVGVAFLLMGIAG